MKDIEDLLVGGGGGGGGAPPRFREMRGRERERALGRRSQGKRTAQPYERFRFQNRRRFQQEVRGYDKRIYNQAIPFFFTNFPEEWSFEQVAHFQQNRSRKGAGDRLSGEEGQDG
ncbi:hypothetical protein SLEP1_g43530 [Rubroshorea leprosula]|uniref:Uncharacterized protein n=1 Tax=Rubroshorea leprosula TaxID=152421 RepID=A0AAV5LD92_9ROSI|nr:hypothetical protein SLEP1_g43530 [Rubroshorea leprosula]